jgi:hypothetical protein
MPWVRLVLKREFTGTIGTIRTILGAKNGVFTGACLDENWAGNIGVWNRRYAPDRAYDIYDYYGALEVVLRLCLGGMLRGRALVGGGSMWWGFYPY